MGVFGTKSEATGTPFSDSNSNSNWSGDEVRKHFVAASGEFVGTFLFLFFSFGGTQVANVITPTESPNTSQLLFIALSFGFSLAVTAWAFYRISGGLFNPAVSAFEKKLGLTFSSGPNTCALGNSGNVYEWDAPMD